MENFNWEAYLENYPDLQGITTQIDAWRHYQRFGIHENRTDEPNKFINQTNQTNKFGTILFYNIICNYIAKCNNLKMTYSEFDKTKQLGIDLYVGTNVYTDTLVLTDKNIEKNYNEVFSKNILIYGTFQISSMAKFVQQQLSKISKKIMNTNPYKARYSANNDLFVHVRIHEKANSNEFEPFEYYDIAISKCTYGNGYISSDSITHPICTKLIRKYNLTVITADEVKVIQFGSTCKNIIVSKSTLSWFIGVFGFYSNVYFPEQLGKINKHGNLFIFKDWNKVNY